MNLTEKLRCQTGYSGKNAGRLSTVNCFYHTLNISHVSYNYGGVELSMSVHYVRQVNGVNYCILAE